MKTLFTAKPITLSDTAEHRIHQRKWWAILILVVGGLLLASRISVPMSFSYTLLFFGHAGMLHRVNPVTRGTRKSLVFWVVGPKFR